MTSAPSLFREGPDLDEILADLDEEYPGQVRVVDVSYDRVGGVMGFFATKNVCVKFTLEDSNPEADLDVVDAAGDDFVDTFHRSAAPTAPAATAGSPLDALLSAAEAEDMIITGRPTAAAAAAPRVADSEIGTDAANVEFARMLLDMANKKAAERRAAQGITDEPTAAVAPSLPAAPAPAPAAPAPIAPAPIAAPVTATPQAVAPAAFPTLTSLMAAAPAPAPAPAPQAPVAQAPAPQAPIAQSPSAPAAAPRIPLTPHELDPVETPRRRGPGAHRATNDYADTSDTAADRTQYSLRRQLVEIGVPVEWIPERTADAYWVIEQLVARVRSAEPSLVRPGDVLAVVGPAREATRGAQELCRRLRLDPNDVLAIGCGDASLDQPWTVANAVAEARGAARAPLVVVIATDDSGSDAASDDAWLRDTVRAVNANQTFLIADATRKPADTRSVMRLIGRTDALIVVGAARTTSPASVWELDVPIALLDGRASSRGAWVALLVDKLTALES